MSRVGQARKRDHNEAEIVKALVQCGAQVLRLGVKDGPDVLVRTRHGQLLLMEIKTAAGQLKPGQKEWQRLWPETIVVRSVDEALAAIGIKP